MVKAHRVEAWDHTAAIIAKLHNVNCAKRKDMVSPEQLNPYRPKAKRKGPDKKLVREKLAKLNESKANG